MQAPMVSYLGKVCPAWAPKGSFECRAARSHTLALTQYEVGTTTNYADRDRELAIDGQTLAEVYRDEALICSCQLNSSFPRATLAEGNGSGFAKAARKGKPDLSGGAQSNPILLYYVERDWQAQATIICQWVLAVKLARNGKRA